MSRTVAVQRALLHRRVRNTASDTHGELFLGADLDDEDLGFGTLASSGRTRLEDGMVASHGCSRIESKPAFDEITTIAGHTTAARVTMRTVPTRTSTSFGLTTFATTPVCRRASSRRPPDPATHATDRPWGHAR